MSTPIQRDRRWPTQRPWQASFGVSATVSPVNLAAFLLHASSSIVFLVFLNATQPFLIAQLGETKHQGALSGTLVFYDELLSMVLVLIWGSMADVVGTKPVAVAGYCFIAVALFSFTFASTPWPDLLYSRLVFAIGGSAVTAMLTGILSSYSANYSETKAPPPQDGEEAGTDESHPLLNHQSGTQRQAHGRLAALVGVTTGCGALIAVFVLLRLPTTLAGLHDKHRKSGDTTDDTLRQGMREAFYIVASLTVLVAVALAGGLKMDAPVKAPTNRRRPALHIEGDDREARRRRLRSRLERGRSSSMLKTIADGVVRLGLGIVAGFALAFRDVNLLLAYIGSALARASTIATTVFVPLLVTRFFYSSGLCTDLPTPDVPTDELKRRCRQAFTVASILSGVIQLMALLLAPLVGYLCDVRSPAQALFYASFLGTISYLVMAIGLPHDGDPRGPLAWISAVGIGFAQIGAIVASLALCAKAKARLAQQEAKQQSHVHATDVPTHSSGAIAGAYSATGGLSILIVSKLGGWLSDIYAPSPFLVMAVLAGLTTIVSTVAIISERRRSQQDDV